VAAICFAWQHSVVRNLYLASLFIRLAVPLMLIPLVDITQGPSDIGAVFRVLITVLTTGLVFAGMWHQYRGQPVAALIH
jgi:hypothetical protein